MYLDVARLFLIGGCAFLMMAMYSNSRLFALLASAAPRNTPKISS
jgi:hypothetical protein